MVIKIKKQGSGISAIFWILYFLMVALPLHATNKWLTYISVTGSISLFSAILIPISVLVLLNKMMRRTLRMEDMICILFILLTGIAFVTGLQKWDAKVAFADAIMYFLSLAILILSSSNAVQYKNVDQFFRLTFYAMTVNLILNTVMYLTRTWSIWGLQAFNEGRYGGGYYSILIVSIIYGFYDFMYTRRIKPSVFAVHIGLAVFCSVLAQSRTHIILSVIGCLFILLLRVKKLNVITFWRILFVIGIGIVAMILFFNSGNPLAERLLSMDIASDTETTASRVWQWMYNIEKIKQSFMGYGFGSRMYFLSSATTLVTNSVSYYVDNAILTVLYKGGWLYGIVYLSYVVRTALKLWTTYRKKRDNESLIALMIFAMLILALMIMSCQITHTYATNAVMWTFIGLVIRQKIYISEMYYNRVVFIIKIATK